MVKDLCVYQKYKFSKGASNQLSQDSRHRLLYRRYMAPLLLLIKIYKKFGLNQNTQINKYPLIIL